MEYGKAMVVTRPLSTARVEKFEDELGLSHLWDGALGEEAGGVEMLEAGGDERAKVLGLDLRLNDLGQQLPGVARAFDDLDHTFSLYLHNDT
jgi:hypothetical protein